MQLVQTYKIPDFAALIGRTVPQILGMIRQGLPVFRNGRHREIDPEVYNAWIRNQTVPLVSTYEKAPARCNSSVGSKVRRIK